MLAFFRNTSSLVRITPSLFRSRNLAKTATLFSFRHIKHYCLGTMAADTKPGDKKVGFRDWVTADGSSGFKADKGRYHLYVALACPFSHRAIMGRIVKGLEDVVSMTVVDYMQDPEKGWHFTDKHPQTSLDPIHNEEWIRDIYLKANPDYSGRFSVPVLFDKEKDTIVNNESIDILRMFNSEFNEFCADEDQKKLDLYPEALRAKIDELNSWIMPKINGGVYSAGFATTQEAYDKGVTELFEAMDKVEGILSKTRYLTGDTVTISDVLLFATLVRFDTVYHGHFKCNKKRVIDYPNMWGYTRDMYQYRGLGETANFLHINMSYHHSFRMRHINPLGIIPIGPELDFTEPHGREKVGQ